MEELSIEINKARSSIFQNENFAYLKSRYEILLSQQEEEHKERIIKISQEANSIAAQANVIAQHSANAAKKALWLAAASMIVSIFGVVVSYFHK